MIENKFSYSFKNGNEVTFILTKQGNNYSIRTEWENFSKEQMKDCLDEYIDKAVPTCYQAIANFVNGTIVWVDKNMIVPPKVFKPINKN